MDALQRCPHAASRRGRRPASDARTAAERWIIPCIWENWLGSPSISPRCASCRYPVDVDAKFTIWRDGIALEQGVVSAGRSHVDAQGEMNGFTDPHWSFRYRGWVDLFDVREMTREPLVPTGVVDVRGEGALANGQYKGSGDYFGESIVLPYVNFTRQTSIAAETIASTTRA